MTIQDSIHMRLAAIGDALEAAAAADVAVTVAGGLPRTRRTRRFRSRRVAVAVAGLAIAIPAAAVAATDLLSDPQVAASLPAGTLSLAGTQPTCTTVTANVEYRCTLTSAPSSNGGPAAGQWLGTVEPTVDASQHVNGGCRSLNGAGTAWECYIGQAAVSQNIIGAAFLGAYSPGPGVG